MRVGHIYLEKAPADGAPSFSALVEALDRLAIEQHVLVADAALARSLRPLPFATVGPVVQTPVMAYCLMPDSDVVHIHDDKAGQAGLLLTLTRSMPYVISAIQPVERLKNPLKRSVYERAQHLVDPALADPEELIEIYRRVTDGWLKLPKDANCG